MTAIDITLVSLAAVQVVALGGMIAAAAMIRERVQEGAQQAAPSIRRAQTISTRLRAMATRTQRDGSALAKRVTTVARKVQRRVATTGKLLREVREQLPVTKASVREVREQGGVVAKQASEARTLAERLGRIGQAARAAVRAADTDGTKG